MQSGGANPFRSISGVPRAGAPSVQRQQIPGKPAIAAPPPVYRPQPSSGQMKSATGAPVAAPPPVYRPQSSSGQMKRAMGTPVAAPPPVYRPQSSSGQMKNATGARVAAPSLVPAMLPQGKLAVTQPSSQMSGPFFQPTALTIQAKGGNPQKKWTEKQYEQSRRFWERKNARIARQAASRAARETRLLSTQRETLMQIDELDEEYFHQYLSSRKPAATVYRGDGRGMNANSLAQLRLSGVDPKPGQRDFSFYGVVDHTHTNSSPGGMVSTTHDKDIAIGFAVDKHNYGLVYEFKVTQYIDVNALLAARNFRNRYEAQYEYLIPGSLPQSAITKVSLYQKGGALVAEKSREEFHGGI